MTNFKQKTGANNSQEIFPLRNEADETKSSAFRLSMQSGVQQQHFLDANRHDKRRRRGGDNMLFTNGIEPIEVSQEQQRYKANATAGDITSPISNARRSNNKVEPEGKSFGIGRNVSGNNAPPVNYSQQSDFEQPSKAGIGYPKLAPPDLRSGFGGSGAAG